MKLNIPKKPDLIKRTRMIVEHLLSSEIGKNSPKEYNILINKIKNSLNAIDKSEIYLFGYHNFSNTGDQALWLSLSLILKSIQDDLKIKLLDNKIENLNSINSRQKILIFPGGGSLGNRYQSSKNRILIIEANPDIRFIQMPISTSFKKDDAWLKRLKSAYAQVNSTTFCRDSRSTKEANEIINIKPITVPDLVEYLPSCEDFKSAEFDELNLIRSDQEATEKNNLFKKEYKNTFDWNDLEKHYPLWDIRKHILLWKSLSDNKLSSLFKNNDGIKYIRFEAAYKISLLKTARALAFLSFYNEITTDRLHGVIMSKNLGLKINYFDNDHGKIQRYISTWSDEYKNVISLD